MSQYEKLHWQAKQQLQLLDVEWQGSRDEKDSSEQAERGTGELIPLRVVVTFWVLNFSSWESHRTTKSSRFLTRQIHETGLQAFAAFCSVFSVQINVLCILNGNWNQIGTWRENYHFGTVIQKEILFQKIWAFCLKQVNCNSDWVSSIKINMFLMVNAF